MAAAHAGAEPARSGGAEPSLQFSVIVPSLGREPGLSRALAALAAQTLPRERYEIIVSLDGPSSPERTAALEARGARVVVSPLRRGPGAARNRGAAAAAGRWLAFTEDDCVPGPGWLAHAAQNIAKDWMLEALAGETVKPGGAPVHRQSGRGPLWLPTSLFVRRDAFERLGGYAEDYFDPVRRLYFREDSDFGFRLEDAGVRWARAREAVVEHPDEHPLPYDALRWAARHQYDALLARRHPARFHERIEVHRLGPFVVRRPVVRAALAHVASLPVALTAAALGQPDVAVGIGGLAALTYLGVWSKWRFRPAHAWAALLVPWVLAAALVRGAGIAARAEIGRTPASAGGA
jgi:GT2 family glycosyltransferase